MARKIDRHASASSSARTRPTRRDEATDTAALRLPQSTRSVTSRLLAARAGESASRDDRREVPEIRLSGVWLERIGFGKGARYLISVEREFRTIILQGKFDEE